MGIEVRKCTIVTGAPEENLSYYSEYLSDRFLISADSGYYKCKKFGVNPDLIIGDFDSSQKPETDIETITLSVRKDDTDTFFAIKEAIKRGYNDIILLGAIGSRVDHTYANLLCLGYCYQNNIKCEIINERNRIICVDNCVTITNEKYEYFSLFAFFDKCEGLTIKGSQYDLDNYTLDSFNQLTQSNSFKDNQVTIMVKSGKILLIQSND